MGQRLCKAMRHIIGKSDRWALWNEEGPVPERATSDVHEWFAWSIGLSSQAAQVDIVVGLFDYFHGAVKTSKQFTKRELGEQLVQSAKAHLGHPLGDLHKMAKDLGLQASVLPADTTIEGLVKAIRRVIIQALERDCLKLRDEWKESGYFDLESEIQRMDRPSKNIYDRAKERSDFVPNPELRHR